MKDTICQIDDRQLDAETLFARENWPCAHRRLMGSVLTLMAITLHRFSTPTPLLGVPESTVGSYLKKGR